MKARRENDRSHGDCPLAPIAGGYPEPNNATCKIYLSLNVRAGENTAAFRRDRNASWRDMFLAGVPIRKIAEDSGISRQQVWKSLKHLGVNAKDRPRPVRAEVIVPKFGCRRSQYRELVRIGAARKYTIQKAQAKVRGIDFNLLLWDWWTIWEQSGKWSERGHTRREYVMCRYGDVGPYAIGNVYIATHSHNSFTAHLNRRARQSNHAGAIA